MVEASVIEERFRAAFPAATVIRLEDLTGSKDHYAAVIVDAKFGGLSRIEQHQAAYRALGELMMGPIHALTLRTYTPEAWARVPEGER